MKTILFVDDENRILKSLMRIFAFEDYEVMFAESGEEGLEILEEDHVDMVISDMRMPLMDGYQFLSKVKEKYPDTIRIILSGYSDEKIIIRALHSNAAQMYLQKPWDNSKLIKVIAAYFRKQEEVSGKASFDFIKKINHLPLLKSEYIDLKVRLDNEPELSDFTKIYNENIRLRANLEKIINNEYFSSFSKDIERNLREIGLSNIKDIILKTDIFEDIEYDVDKDILNDVGKLLMFMKIGKRYVEFFENHKCREEERIELEKEEFSTSSAELEKLVYEWWGFCPLESIEGK